VSNNRSSADLLVVYLPSLLLHPTMPSKHDKQNRRNEAIAKRRSKKSGKSAPDSSMALSQPLTWSSSVKQVISRGMAPPKLSAAKALARQQMKLKQKELRASLVTNKRNKNNSMLPANIQASMQQENMSLASILDKAQEQAQHFDARHGKENRSCSASNMEIMADNANGNMNMTESQSLEKETNTSNNVVLNDHSRKAYMKELKKVVERADVILEILDARDPMGCRTIEMEDRMRSKGKKVVLVLNKIDLVPPEVLLPWLQYLRSSYPTIAFKASTQEKHVSSASVAPGSRQHSKGVLCGSRAVGTDALMQLLKNYCRNNQIKTAITIGVIGYPNVGKSSVINSLKRSKAASVSSMAGHSKVLQEIQIDHKIKLIDCPGIVFDTSDAERLILRNCVNAEAFSDPIPAVEVILRRCAPEYVTALYRVPPFHDAVEFLVSLAKAHGKLGKGGVPDRKAVARMVLHDWNRGKIPFYTPPPVMKDTRLDDETCQIVSSFGEDFDVMDATLNPRVSFLPSENAENHALGDNDNAIANPPHLSSSSMMPSMAAPSMNQTMAKNEVSKNVRMTQNICSDDDSDSDKDDASVHDHMPINCDLSKKIMGIHDDDDDDDLVPHHITSNRPIGLMNRRQAKALRKQKRKEKKQYVGVILEDDLSHQLDNVNM
jgi:ribosome biogenesis GTPase A